MKNERIFKGGVITQEEGEQPTATDEASPWLRSAVDKQWTVPDLSAEDYDNLVRDAMLWRKHLISLDARTDRA